MKKMLLIGLILLIGFGGILLFYSNKPGENFIESVITTTTVKKSRLFRVEDRTAICAQAIENVYSDDEFIYTLPCIKSSTILLIFDDGEEITLRDALNNHIVSIRELDEAGLYLHRLPKR